MRDYESLQGTHCAIIDVTSAAMVSRPRVAALLSEPVGSGAQGALRRKISVDQELSHALEVLARMIVYDFVVIDKFGWDEHEFALLTEQLIQPVRIPRETYSAASAKLKEFRKTSRMFPRGRPLSPDQRSDLRRDRSYFGRLSSVYKLPGVLRLDDDVISTAPTLSRVFFYLELSHAIRVPVFLSPAKAPELAEVRAQLVGEAYKLVESNVNETVFADFQTAFKDVYGIEYTFPEPPLVSMIIRNAETKGMSLLDSALAIRETAAAADFRRWLRELQAMLSEGDHIALKAAAARMAKLQDEVREWRLEETPETGISKKQSKMGLEVLPYIGWLLKLFGLGDVAFDDRYLEERQNYLAFIAGWYRRDVRFAPEDERVDQWF